MKRIIYLSLIYLFSMVHIYSQTWSNPYNEVREFTLNELEILNNKFKEDLESLIKKTSCPNLEDESYKYFVISFTENDNIYIELYKLPVADFSYGYFTLSNYIFFVNGHFPTNLFKKKCITQGFAYKRGRISTTEDFPSWIMTFVNGQLKLIENDCW